MSTLDSMSPYRKNDLVLIKHRKLYSDEAHASLIGQGHGERCALAMVLDTKPKITYVVYVAGKGSEAKLDPFWIDNNCLISYGDDHESRRHHGGHESPTK